MDKIKECIGLLNSMVASGENHTETSFQVVNEAREELNKMSDRLIFLDALEAAGVDNWSGYSHAHELMEEWQE